jgi:23S rRNA (uracil1939-C5)-methyltransferase
MLTCPQFGRCGGCAIYDLTPAQQSDFKREKIVEALAKQGLTAQVHPTIQAQGAGRRRVSLHAQKGVLGFNAYKSNEVIAIEHCPLLEDNLQEAFPLAQKILDKSNLKEADFHFTLAANGLDLTIEAEKPLNEKLRAALLMASEGFMRFHYNDKLIAQRDTPFIFIAGEKIMLPARSFLQATSLAAELLTVELLKRKGKAKRAVDFFAGLGTFTLPLAKFMAVDSFEQDEAAVAAFNTTLRLAQGFKPIKAYARDLFRRPLIPYELKPYDLAVLDPPRAGAQKQCEELVKASLNHIIMVSCNPETFARDVKILTKGGFVLGEVTPIDQFTLSPHIEMIAALTRKI